MFTGIVAAVGRIERVEPLGQEAGVRLTVDAGGLDLSDVAPGDSIAIQGACMTAVGIDGGRFVVEVSRESLSRTRGLDRVGEVNRRRCGWTTASAATWCRGTSSGSATSCPSSRSASRGAWCARARGSPSTSPQGSVTVNGVSLTVNRVADGRWRRVRDQPDSAHDRGHDAEVADGRPGQPEVDLIARYVSACSARRRQFRAAAMSGREPGRRLIATAGGEFVEQRAGLGHRLFVEVDERQRCRGAGGAAPPGRPPARSRAIVARRFLAAKHAQPRPVPAQQRDDARAMPLDERRVGSTSSIVASRRRPSASSASAKACARNRNSPRSRRCARSLRARRDAVESRPRLLRVSIRR